MNCRSCGHLLGHSFLNLQHSPPSNSFLTEEMLGMEEPYFPLNVHVCERCFLVQIDEYAASRSIFNAGYVYFSSYSEVFVKHASDYVSHITGLLGLYGGSMVYEAASNDGYLLQFFKAQGIPCCGIEPSKSVADVALAKGIPTEVEFFTASFASQLAQRKGKADLFIGNNVMAHVPDLNDFIAGIKFILKPDGVATIEFPHLLHLMRNLEFDTIYHEHYSYFSLLAVQGAFTRHGLKTFHVEELPVHGGSLRVYVAHAESPRAVDETVGNVLADEMRSGLGVIETFAGFQDKVDALCRDFLHFLVTQKKAGKKVAGYGAAAKGNTLLNYCGVRPYLLDFVADITPAKQGKFLPGSHIPVYGEEAIAERKPDYIVILPWNWKDSIAQRLDYTRAWGAQFVTVIPSVTVF
ncbi:MAG: class I SAM-dependent methyltransferase [Kiritimatiellaeota bacterium]|nr:class I SAM-dependent methyltransferase [Kiritimatiellota bacterium]